MKEDDDQEPHDLLRAVDAAGGAIDDHPQPEETGEKGEDEAEHPQTSEEAEGV